LSTFQPSVQSKRRLKSVGNFRNMTTCNHQEGITRSITLQPRVE
jgi:hypothetical protein